MQLAHGRASRRAVTGIILLALALVAACGGGGSTTLTADQAQEVADASLLQVADLPDGNWDVTDDQANLQDLLPTGAAGQAGSMDVPEQCQTLLQTMTGLESSVGDIKPIASSGRSFSIIGDTLDARVVSSSVLVFAEASEANAASDALAKVLDSNGLEDCLTSALGPMTDAGIAINDFRIDRPDYALDGATGLSIQVDAVAFILPIKLGIDIHIFDRGHTLAMYLAFQLNGEDLAGANADLLGTFAQRVEDAQP